MIKPEGTPHIVSFYGADGCGKSTIARVFTETVNGRGGDCAILGGSSYKSWLTPALARDFLGSDHRLDQVCETDDEKTLLYEDIAIACYGLAARVRDDGGSTAIDSDPFLKRIIWSRVVMEDAAAQERYLERFNNRMTDHLGEAAGPSVVVGVNMQQDVSAAELLDRISRRGEESDHDPTELTGMLKLVSVVQNTWDDIYRGASGDTEVHPAFRGRLLGSRILFAANPECGSGEVMSQAQRAAETLLANF